MDGDIDNFDRRFGAQLKALRKRRNLSLPDVAAEIGVSYQQLQKHESGRNSLSVHRTLMIANALEVDLQTILGLMIPQPDAEELSEFIPRQRPGERHRLLKAYFALPEAIRLAFLDLLEGTACHQCANQ